VLFVGRLHPVKYPEDAIRAFAMIKRRVSNACMLVVGTGVLREELERTAEEEGVSGSVIFLGRKGYGELVDILYTADVLLAPHGGMTLVEAALASTPAVAYDFDWHSEFIRDGETGYIVPFRDHRGMADKAVRILTDDPLRQGMGSRCRALALSSCSREISIRREKSVYGELVGR
jgi:glycosyltransferase involved in cell wall biosynthesis